MTWTCLNCLHTGHLDSHGRCARCSSDAVAISESLRPSGRPCQDTHSSEVKCQREAKIASLVDMAWVRRVVEEASK